MKKSTLLVLAIVVSGLGGFLPDERGTLLGDIFEVGVTFGYLPWFAMGYILPLDRMAGCTKILHEQNHNQQSSLESSLTSSTRGYGYGYFLVVFRFVLGVIVCILFRQIVINNSLFADIGVDPHLEYDKSFRNGPWISTISPLHWTRRVIWTLLHTVPAVVWVLVVLPRGETVSFFSWDFFKSELFFMGFL